MDIDKVSALLHIVDKSRQWPTLQPIHDQAMVELAEHVESAREEAKRRAEAAKEAAEKKAEEEAAAAKAAQEERDRPVERPQPTSVPGIAGGDMPADETPVRRREVPEEVTNG